jgi:acetyl esterase/lipase
MVRAAGREILLLDAPTVRATLCKLTPHMTDAERKSPATSPLYADLAGLPPALFVVGTEDMLLEDSRRMEARWGETNGNSEILIVPEGSHAFDRMGTAAAAKVERYADVWILERLT